MPNVGFNIAGVNSWNTGAMKITGFSVSASYLLKSGQRLVYSPQKAEIKCWFLYLIQPQENHLWHHFTFSIWWAHCWLAIYAWESFQDWWLLALFWISPLWTKLLSPLRLVEMILKPSDEQGKQSPKAQCARRTRDGEKTKLPEMRKRKKHEASSVKKSCYWPTFPLLCGYPSPSSGIYVPSTFEF